VRHFRTELGTPKPAVFALEAATSVRSRQFRHLSQARLDPTAT